MPLLTPLNVGGKKAQPLGRQVPKANKNKSKRKTLKFKATGKFLDF